MASDRGLDKLRIFAIGTGAAPLTDVTSRIVAYADGAQVVAEPLPGFPLERVALALLLSPR